MIGYVCLCRVRTDNRAILGIRAHARREMRCGYLNCCNSFERRQLTDKVFSLRNVVCKVPSTLEVEILLRVNVMLPLRKVWHGVLMEPTI